jgi:hypothetical protein
MKNMNQGPLEKMKADKNNATRPFSNAENDFAVEINKGGDPKSRNYMEKDDTGSEGPNWDVMSKDVDGDTGPNAGVFK